MRARAFVLMVVVALGLSAVATASEDIVLADFEGETYGDWAVAGTAFGPGPARGTLPNQMPVSGYIGERLVNSFYGGDRSIGTLTSPEFKIERKFITFYVGGGKFPGRTCINLIVDGRIARTVAGENDRPGGSERLLWHVWDVSGMVGKMGQIQIVDQVTQAWGHITADHFVMTDDRSGGTLRKEFEIEKRCLNLPVQNGSPKRRMRVIVDGRTAREFEIELAERTPDFWVFLDLTPFAGKKAVVEVEGLTRGSRILDQLAQADEIRGAENLYHERLRPQFHFTSRRGWNNDSNGLVFHKGLWHLYYQHNPYGILWGNMHWGHAVSKDLVHWQELPIAIYPQRFDDWVFSGSAVVDVNNTSGFGRDGQPPIVAAYTSTGRGECIVYSNDDGRTFTEFEGNPVVRHSGRDPKVIWYGPGRHWVMALYDEADNKRKIAFYTSADLKKWEFASQIDGFFECPEIFDLPIEGEAGQSRWVVYAADGDYMIGSFDGRVFTPESGKNRYSHGNCFYASQTYNNVPPEDGRRVQIAWGQVQMPGMPFNQMMLFPVELTLRRTGEGVRMFAKPVREIEGLYEKTRDWKDVEVSAGSDPIGPIEGELMRVQATLRPAGAAKCGFTVRGTQVTYDVAAGKLSCLDKTAPLSPVDGAIRLELLVDRASIEIFANDGQVYMPMGVVLPEDNKSVRVFAEGGPVKVESLEVHLLKSIWP
ncbi:MAG: glycoside hydrolase family 32 protein [Solirubrobacterales bacterium]